MKPRMTPEIARAAGMDAGERSARAAGRKVWNVDDYNAAVKETSRLLDLIATPRMMPGQTPYTKGQIETLAALVRDAADGDPGEGMDVAAARDESEP